MTARLEPKSSRMAPIVAPPVVPCAAALSSEGHLDSDSMIQAAEARLTRGVPPTAMWLACLDVASHLTNAPFRRAALTQAALNPFALWPDALAGQQVIEARPRDQRFACPACRCCAGGAVPGIAAAAMARDGDERPANRRLPGAQAGFSEAGELQLFISEDQLRFLNDLMASQGYLDSHPMTGAFHTLRSNDLAWSRMPHNDLLGRPTPTSDLMTRHADGTRMPARMHGRYLHWMHLENRLAEGHFMVWGRPVSLADILLSLFVVGIQTDHVAPWHWVCTVHLLNDGEITFVLASGAHNAGIVSEPGHAHRHFRLRLRKSEGSVAGSTQRRPRPPACPGRSRRRLSGAGGCPRQLRPRALNEHPT